MNRVFMIGRLVKPVEIKSLGNDKKVANFTLAVNRNADREKVDFIPCSAWNKTAEVLEKYTTKGSQILIEGEVNIDKSNDQYYTKVVVSKVELLAKATSGEAQTQQTEYVAPQPEAPNFKEIETETFAIQDSELPF